MSVGALIDLTRCIGCRSCQVACKSWNDNPGEQTSFWGTYDNPPTLTPITWSLVKFAEVEAKGSVKLVMSKIQCMHCINPACIAVCPEQVYQKEENGAVTVDSEKCIGCQNCMKVCPFGVPHINWVDNPDLAFVNVEPQMTKCVFCFDRISNGMEPACVKACPTNALTFGDRDELLVEARKRMAKFPDKYVDHIYGEHEVGGTAWMYLSPVPFEALGFVSLPADPIDVSQYKPSYLYPGIEKEREPVSPLNIGVTSGLLGVLAGAASIIALRQLRMKKSDVEMPEE